MPVKEDACNSSTVVVVATPTTSKRRKPVSNDASPIYQCQYLPQMTRPWTQCASCPRKLVPVAQPIADGPMTSRRVNVLNSPTVGAEEMRTTSRPRRHAKRSVEAV
uniref:Uncharacterized protein n=1 Tax=Mesocestoides corti TaxID=53468 RepID=A0A5K3G559_MESCO